MEGRIDSRQDGPGAALVSFNGIVDTLNYACTTPIAADRCIVRFNFRFKTMGDEATTANVGKAFVAEVAKQMEEDRPIWEHKAHLVRPALADNDGPFMKFRKWMAQFYAEPIGDERTVYPPPFWPDRLDDAPAKATAAAEVRKQRLGARRNAVGALGGAAVAPRRRRLRGSVTLADTCRDVERPRCRRWRDRRTSRRRRRRARHRSCARLVARQEQHDPRDLVDGPDA